MAHDPSEPHIPVSVFILPGIVAAALLFALFGALFQCFQLTWFEVTGQKERARKQKQKIDHGCEGCCKLVVACLGGGSVQHI
jgi:hypothetical protein